MNLASLISRFRTEANDKVVPYFWSDSEVTDWLNDAVNEACIRGRLIYEASNASMCEINVTTGRSVYPLHAAMYEIARIRFVSTDNPERSMPLCLVSTETLIQIDPNWHTLTTDMRYAMQDDKNLRLVPMPKTDGVVYIEGYRLPKDDMESLDDEPEINKVHHRHLVHWALYKAFGIPDAESFDPNRSDRAELAFTKYFGERPDSDLRRITREDVEHHVQPFWV